MTVAVASGNADLVSSDAAPPYPPPELVPAYRISARPSLPLERFWTGTYWIVRERETGIFGHAVDLSDALRDFGTAVKEHLDVLERQPELSPDLSWQLEYLRARVTS